MWSVDLGTMLPLFMQAEENLDFITIRCGLCGWSVTLSAATATVEVLMAEVSCHKHPEEGSGQSECSAES